jgi:hypothetical protein
VYRVIEEVVADKGCHSRTTVNDLETGNALFVN